MDLEAVLKTYFQGVTAEILFSGQKNGDVRNLIEQALTETQSLVLAGTPTREMCAGLYPVVLVEYPAAFDRDRPSQELAMEILTSDLGAHAFQTYFLNELGRLVLLRRILYRNILRRATAFYIGGKLGHVSSCKNGESLYSLIIAKTPIPRRIAAA